MADMSTSDVPAAHLPYGGIVSFVRSPVVDLGHLVEHSGPETAPAQADFGVLGIPFDIALGFRPGARFAPRALREASLRSLPPFTGLDGVTHLKNARFIDAGDVVLPSLEPELAHDRTTEAAQKLRQRCRVPIFLGGDHSVSYPLLRAFSDVPNLHIVQIDAHLDFTDVRNGTRWSNSSPFRRACEALPNLVHITTLGLRGLRFDQEAVAAARGRGHALVTLASIRENISKVLGQIPSHQNVYISIDVDAFDPALVPATSSPEPEGLSYKEGVQLLNHTAKQNNIVGIDLVELAPNLDSSGRSELFMMQVLMELLIAVDSNKLK